MSKPVTNIAPHTFIKGDLRLEGPAVIGGHVQGDLTAADVLEVGPEGIIEGNIQAVAVTIHGTVKGNVVASQACRLGATARVAGDLCAGHLTTAPGARFIGQVCLGDDMAGPAECVEPAASGGHGRLAAEGLEETEAMQVVEATVSRIEHAQARAEPQMAPVPMMMTVPTMPAVQVLTQNVQATLQRAPRIIKAR